MHFNIKDLLAELKANPYRDLNEVYEIFRGVDIDDHNKFEETQFDEAYNLMEANETLKTNITAGEFAKCNCTQEEKEKYAEYQQQSKEHAIIEASLANPGRSHKIGLVTVNRAHNEVKFVVKANLIVGGETMVDVLPSWVMKNFDKRVIATVCKVFTEAKPPEPFYVHVDNFQVTVPNDKQFYKIRYVKNGRLMHYLGLIKVNDAPQHITVSDA